jgi:dihydroxyacetone kinase-like predicted kinase
VLAAEHAAEHASKPTLVLPTRTMQAGLSALVAFDAERPAAENLAEMRAAAEAVATGAVYENGGTWIGVADGTPVAEGSGFDEVAAAIVERLLAEPRSVLTVLTGVSPPPLDGLLAALAAAHPRVEVEVHEGGQRRFALLLGAE